MISLSRAVRFGAVTFLALCVGCGRHDTQQSSAAAAQEPDVQMQRVRTETARTATIYPTLMLPGAIAPHETVALSNSINEPTSAVYVREGDHVRAGQALADLDVSDLQASLRSSLETAESDRARTSVTTYNARLVFSQAPDQVRQARAALAQAMEATREANRNLTRDTTLAAQGYLPTQNVDEQRVVVRSDMAAELSARAQVNSAVANQVQNGTPETGMQASNIAEQTRAANAASATADQLRSEISRAHIVSPIDGYVINRNLNPGEYPSGRQIFTIEGTDTVYAILTASSVQAYEIATGDRVQVTRPGFRSGSFLGRVEALLDAGTPGSSNFTVKVAIPNPGNHLRAGTPVQAIVNLGGFHGIAIASTAFTTDARDHVVSIDNGHARTLGVHEIATDGVTSIVEGIGSGTVLVRDGTTELRNGEAVTAVR